MNSSKATPRRAVSRQTTAAAPLISYLCSSVFICGSTSLFCLLAGCAPPASALPTEHETIIFLRHGEKPPAGLGQIDCQGLNRALALPPVLAKRYGTPAAIFAPDPAQTVQDRGITYDYIRPLATIEPTAIRLGLPLNASFGVRDTTALEHELLAPSYQNSTIFVAWEHRIIVTLARDLLTQAGADPAAVPDWPSNDFDSLYVIAITHRGTHITANFTHESEGLNNLPAACP
jgi:hypothetical protein